MFISYLFETNLASDHDVRRFVLVPDRQDVVAGLRLRLPDEERSVLSFLQQLLGRFAGQVAVKPTLRCRIGAVQRMTEFDHFTAFFFQLKRHRFG